MNLKIKKFLKFKKEFFEKDLKKLFIKIKIINNIINLDGENINLF